MCSLNCTLWIVQCAVQYCEDRRPKLCCASWQVCNLPLSSWLSSEEQDFSTTFSRLSTFSSFLAFLTSYQQFVYFRNCYNKQMMIINCLIYFHPQFCIMQSLQVVFAKSYKKCFHRKGRKCIWYGAFWEMEVSRLMGAIVYHWWTNYPQITIISCSDMKYYYFTNLSFVPSIFLFLCSCSVQTIQHKYIWAAYLILSV